MLYQLIQNSKRIRRRKINNYQHHHQQRGLKTTLTIAENFNENCTLNIFQSIHFCNIVTYQTQIFICLIMCLITKASDSSFYPFFKEKFDQFETLLSIYRLKNVLSAESLCDPLVPSPQSRCPKRTFILPQRYHASVSNMLS